MALVGKQNYDGLITDISPEVFVAGATIRKEASAKAEYKRGTVFAKSGTDNKLVVLGTSAVADVEEKFSGDGEKTEFTLSAQPASLKSVKVGGVDEPGYTYSAGVVTFSSAPAVGTDNIVITYEDASEVFIPYGILCEDVEVDTDADVTAAIYTAGCFDPDKLIVAEGYTITEADKDTLRNGGIFLKAATDN